MLLQVPPLASGAVALNVFTLSNPLLKVLLPLVGIGAVWLVSTRRFHLNMRDDLRLVAPAPGPTLLWLALALAWMLGTDYLMNWRGPWNFGPWQVQAGWVSVARVLGVGILGPITEELIFRGLLYARLRQARLNEWLVIMLLAAGWALLHQDYSAAIIAVIFVEGLLLGTARRFTGSLVVPILMHIAWNLYAVW
jgi:membrane protease YdiL (CAAX protease family)